MVVQYVFGGAKQERKMVRRIPDPFLFYWSKFNFLRAALSQEQLANRTGLTAKYISLIEKGAI